MGVNLPAYIINKIYVKSSLCQLDNKISLKVNNLFLLGDIIRINDCTLNNKKVPLNKIYFNLKKPIYFDDINYYSFSKIPKNQFVEIFIDGSHLGKGQHTLIIHMVTKAWGSLKVQIDETLF